MSASLLSTKLYIPSARSDGVSRPRLTGKLTTGLSQPGSFALISGPAGFGKTTLLSEYAAALEGPVAWVSLDAGDNDPTQFWTYVISACQTIQAEIGESVLSLLQLPQALPIEAVPSLLINELALFEHNLTLILDDYHTIQNERIHAGIAFLLEHLPKNLHLLISTRVDPPWPLARFRSRNQLVEIRAQDLRFSTEEAASFLNRMMELGLTSEDVESLEERTEGWAAGLQLAALSMKGRSDATGFVKALKGSHVYIAGYLIEEVLMLQPIEVQDFLLQTSILDRLNGDLCEAVTGNKQSQTMLFTLQHKNLFVISLDDENNWFRYHNLFADLLLAKLQSSSSKDRVNDLHNRAAKWYEQADLVNEAVEHSLKARDYPNVVRLVERNALQLILQAHVRTVEAWLKTIPQEYLDKSPRINLACAWLNLMRGSISQSMPYIERIENFFSTFETEDLDPSLMGEWLALQAKVLSVKGKSVESRDLSNKALTILPETDFLMRSMVTINLATVFEQLLDYDHAAETFQAIARNARLIGDYTFEILGLSGQARMELIQGHLRKTFEIATEGIRRIEDTGKTTPFSATFYGELSSIYYQWHQYEMAQSLSLRSVQASGKSGYSDPEIYHSILISKMFQIEGDWESAERETQKAIDLADRIPPAMIREDVISQHVRIHLAFGRNSEAQKLLAAGGFNFGDEFIYPDLATDAKITQPIGLLYNSALRVLISEIRDKQNPEYLKSGLGLAERVLANELQCCHIPAAIETLLIRSQLFNSIGDEQNRLADVLHALELGEPERFISVFAEEGKPVADALMILLKRNQLGSVHTGYVQAVLEGFPKSISTSGGFKGKRVPNVTTGTTEMTKLEPLIEALTAREMEVLQLIAAGDSNQEIASNLVITVSAVKKHIGNIFGKLNVKSRTQAIARARQHNLLNPTDN